MAPPSGVLEHIDAGIDLECRAQLDVHGAHEMILLEQQQRLPIDLLSPELLRDLLAAYGEGQHQQTLSQPPEIQLGAFLCLNPPQTVFRKLSYQIPPPTIL